MNDENHPKNTNTDGLIGPSVTRSGTSGVGKDTSPATSVDPPSSIRTLLMPLPSLSRVMSFAVLVLGIFGVGVLFFRVMVGFFVPLFLAAMLVVIFRPVHEWILKKLKGRERVASVVTTTLITLAVLMPVLLLIPIAAGQHLSLLRRVDFGDLQTALENGRTSIGLTVDHPGHYRRLSQIANSLQSVEPAKLDSSELTEAANLILFLEYDSSFELANSKLLPAADLVLKHGNSSPSDLMEWLQAPRTDVNSPDNDKAFQVIDDAVAKIPDDEKLVSLAALIQQTDQPPTDDVESQPLLSVVDELSIDEQISKDAKKVSTKIHSWMEAKLGGSIWGPMRLAANVSDTQYNAMIDKVRGIFQTELLQITGQTGSLLLTLVMGMGIMVFSLYFFLNEGPAMLKTLMRLTPLDDEYERQLLLEFDRTSRAVVLASVLSALAQGVLSAIAYYFLGFESVILLFFLTSVMALVPFVGAASVWVPCVLWLAAVEHSMGSAIFLLIYGTLIISSVDNVIKVFVLQGRSQLHPLPGLLSVLGGVSVFGPVGILVGPMVVVFLQTLLEILYHELGSDSDDAADVPAGADG